MVLGISETPDGGHRLLDLTGASHASALHLHAPNATKKSHEGNHPIGSLDRGGILRIAGDGPAMEGRLEVGGVRLRRPCVIGGVGPRRQGDRW